MDIENMLGLGNKLVECWLKLKISFKYLKLKLRKLDPRVKGKVKEGLEELATRFMRIVDHPEWLASIIIVPKGITKSEFI